MGGGNGRSRREKCDQIRKGRRNLEREGGRREEEEKGRYEGYFGYYN